MKKKKKQPVEVLQNPGAPNIHGAGSDAAAAAAAAQEEQRLLSTHGRSSNILASDPQKRARSRDLLGAL